ncbi:MAG: hypothetical protein HY078_13310 [Elusimicrobia bacterium]|nr:hypothetical protein [Elusimicrobiota bacterium]
MNEEIPGGWIPIALVFVVVTAAGAWMGLDYARVPSAESRFKAGFQLGRQSEARARTLHEAPMTMTVGGPILDAPGSVRESRPVDGERSR